MSETTVVKLSKPIKDKDGNEITELTLREPLVGDLIKAEKFQGKIAYTTAMMASVTGHTIPVLEGMRAADFNKCDRAMGGLMGNFRDQDGDEAQS